MSAAERAGGGQQAPTVLIVEDEAGLAEVLHLHLEAGGYRALVAHDGLEALYLLDRELPAVVLLDLNLPQVSGFRLMELLRRGVAGNHPAVILLTALSFEEAEEAVRAGADGFVVKPFEPAQVVELVAQTLARRMGRLSSPPASA